MNNPLIDVDEIVNTKVKSMVDSGEIAKMIEAKIENTISQTVDEELRSYSDFGKNLKAYINKSVQVDFDKLGFEGYHENLLRVISKVYKQSLESEHLNKVKIITEEMLANPPELVTLSSLVEAVKEKASEHARDQQDNDDYESYTYESEITCIIEGRGDRHFTYLCLDPRENVSSNSCAYRIGISKINGEMGIFSLRMNNQSSDDLFVTETYGLERLLFKAKCASSAFEFDVESPDLSYTVEIEPNCHC